MTGSAGRVGRCISYYIKGGSLREGGLKSSNLNPGWRMTGSAGRAGRCISSYILYQGRESEGGKGEIFCLIRPWRMTGSALTRWELHRPKNIFIEGGSPREGGHEIVPDRRLVDDGKRWTRWTLCISSYILYQGRESEGGKGEIFCRVGPWRMTGSALTSWEFHRRKIYL